jgi:hypothetical protein
MMQGVKTPLCIVAASGDAVVFVAQLARLMQVMQEVMQTLVRLRLHQPLHQ